MFESQLRIQINDSFYYNLASEGSTKDDARVSEGELEEKKI